MTITTQTAARRAYLAAWRAWLDTDPPHAEVAAERDALAAEVVRLVRRNAADRAVRAKHNASGG